MNEAEAKEVVKVLISSYPAMYKEHSKEQLELMAKVWASGFKNVPASIVKKALFQVMLESESPYPPVIGQITAEIKKQYSVLDADKQWDMLMWIVRNVSEQLHLAPKKYMDAISQQIVGEQYIRKLKSDSKYCEFEKNNFLKRYNTLKADAEREAINTGNLLLMSNEEKLQSLGVTSAKLLNTTGDAENVRG
jgi:hypothetical protein